MSASDPSGGASVCFSVTFAGGVPGERECPFGWRECLLGDRSKTVHRDETTFEFSSVGFVSVST